jgi:hypothetical protein
MAQNEKGRINDSFSFLVKISTAQAVRRQRSMMLQMVSMITAPTIAPINPAP